MHIFKCITVGDNIQQECFGLNAEPFMQTDLIYTFPNKTMNLSFLQIIILAPVL